jgi:hypothetical protein
LGLFCKIVLNGFGDESCVSAFGLQAAKFLERTVKSALGGGSGAVDGGLEAVERFVVQIFRRHCFEIGAAAETPGGVDDFAGEGVLERGGGREFGQVAGFEVIKDVALFGADEVRDGEEAEFGGVLGDAGFTLVAQNARPSAGLCAFTFDRDRAVGPFGVLPIGQDLSLGGHAEKRIAEASSGVWLSCWKQEEEVL